MNIRKHKNNRWFTLRLRRVHNVPHGQRWTGSKRVPRPIEQKPGPTETHYRYGSDKHAVQKAFCAHQNTNLQFLFVAVSTPAEIANRNLTPV